MAFIDLNDGSSISGMQAVVSESSVAAWAAVESGSVSTGAAVAVRGKLVASPGGKQAAELSVENLELIGAADPETYPLQKKRHTLEYLRSIAHLRPRTNTIGAVSRVRNQLAYATHKFFQENGFLYANTPIITASDCEGAGEQFQVTTLLNGLDQAASVTPETIAEAEAKVKVQGEAVKALKEAVKGW
jgi:asparaginyl-tRNA synthetase